MTNQNTNTSGDGELRKQIEALPRADETDLAIGDGICLKVSDIIAHLEAAYTRGKRDGRSIASWRAETDRLVEAARREMQDSERKFLERLKLEFDANISVDAGEAWSDSDAAEMLNNRLAHLSNNNQEENRE